MPLFVGENCSQQLLREIGAARWHPSCYKRYTLKKTLDIEEKRFEIRRLSESTDVEQSCAPTLGHFTRSNDTIYQKNCCFFVTVKVTSIVLCIKCHSTKLEILCKEQCLEMILGKWDFVKLYLQVMLMPLMSFITKPARLKMVTMFFEKIKDHKISVMAARQP